MAHPHPGTRPAPTPSVVRAELDRILASDIFSRSDRLSAFLRFIVEQTLDGHADTLKEQVIATELYGKGADFSTAADPIVRVDARRLRDKLREYYASAPNESLVISVPKGSYVPVFHLNGSNALPVAQHVSPAGFPVGQDVSPAGVPVENVSPSAPDRGVGASRSQRPHSHARQRPHPHGGSTAAFSRSSTAASTRVTISMWIGAALLVTGVTAWIIMTRGTEPRTAPVQLLTVTSLPGAEEDPALSPDGTFVAFSWGPQGPPLAAHIWIKAVDADGMRQLTDSDGFEKYPDWSPDGRDIAFTQMGKGPPSVHVVSALGGPARLIAEDAIYPRWLPDGRSLVMVSRTPDGHSAVVHHQLESGARRQLTQAPAGFVESHPRVSPDGSAVAFQRTGEGRSALLVVPIGGGTPSRIGDWYSGMIGGLTWTADGKDIIFGRPELSGRRLVRVRVDAPGAAEPLAAAPSGSVAPSVSRRRADGTFRVAFVSGQPDVGLRLIDLSAAGRSSAITSVPFCDATRMDVPGHFSRDGTRVAFVSDRSGTQQVWVAARDGSGLRSVTSLQDATINVGSWSPDSRWIAFDATLGGNTDIYRVRVDGGPVERLTTGTAGELDPEWSRDGRLIYYSSNETGASSIWKMPAQGGAGVRLTSERGYDPRESPDGESVYFVDRPRDYGLGPIARLSRISTQGGPATPVDISVMPGAWDVTDEGIVFVMGHVGAVAAASQAPDVLAVYGFADHRVRPLGELAERVAPWGANRFFIVSPDGRSAMASHIDSWNRDIMVFDNFR